MIILMYSSVFVLVLLVMYAVLVNKVLSLVGKSSFSRSFSICFEMHSASRSHYNDVCYYIGSKMFHVEFKLGLFFFFFQYRFVPPLPVSLSNSKVVAHCTMYTKYSIKTKMEHTICVCVYIAQCMHTNTTRAHALNNFTFDWSSMYRPMLTDCTVCISFYTQIPILLIHRFVGSFVCSSNTQRAPCGSFESLRIVLNTPDYMGIMMGAID